MPIQVVTLCNWLALLRTWPFSALIPRANRKASENTIVEWPSEKKKPTLIGRFPSAISLRVVLSIAEM